MLNLKVLKNRGIWGLICLLTLLVFVFTNSFGEIVYVKKKGDSGPPPEGASAQKSSDSPQQSDVKNSESKTSPTEEYKIPAQPQTANSKDAYKSIYVYSGLANSKSIALTFDDGPNANFTPSLLTILQEKNVKATFFLLGEQVKLFPAQAKSIAEAGHELGCHSYSHPNLRKASKETIEKEIADTQDLIEKTAGVRPKVFRPPYGNSSSQVVDICKKNGIDYFIFWTVDTNDWKTNSTKDSIIEKALKEAKGGAIILMHDRFTKSVEAAAVIIDKLKEKGYNFVTVSELIKERDNIK